MEYRGYDSVGVATHDNDSICMRRGAGRVQEVNDQKGLDALSGVTGLGHTRWATHGAVTDINAHPHMSSSGDVAIVHVLHVRWLTILELIMMRYLVYYLL